MKKIIAIASAAVLGLGVAACDSGAENTAEEQADAALETSEVPEDAAEDAADNMDAAPE